jgi:hypothetical protein
MTRPQSENMMMNVNFSLVMIYYESALEVEESIMTTYA